jgi:hypothetical protein
MQALNWPGETACFSSNEQPCFAHARSNICLDFHGDPSCARLVVFSDGNHHMALQETLHAFLQKYPAVKDVFYTTTPPRVAMQMLRSGSLDIGNLRLTISPHVFISPPTVMDRLLEEKLITSHRPFMRSRGVALLLRKDNPKAIYDLRDLLRQDVKLFLSNPVTEKVSNQIYMDCLRRLGMHEGITFDFLSHPPGKYNKDKLMYGEAIHHREAPQAVFDGEADVALVFYHLALRYQRIFPEHFYFVRAEGAVDEHVCDINYLNCGLIGNGGEWGKLLIAFLASEEVAAIYNSHGLDRIA